jgi:hypothetical protein
MMTQPLIYPDRRSLLVFIKFSASTLVVFAILLPFVLITVQRWQPRVDYILNDGFDGCFDESCFHDGIQKAIWRLEVGYGGRNETQCFTNQYENVHVVPGQLVISSQWNGGKSNCAWLSARVISQKSMTWPLQDDMIIEARIKMNITNATGGFRLKPTNDETCGEINVIGGTICAEQEYSVSVDAHEWHIYKLKLAHNKMSWYIDDVLYHEAKMAKSPFYIVFDIVHHDVRQDENNVMNVDWIRVY